MMNTVTIFLGALFSMIAFGWLGGDAIDLTLEKDATGADVVLAVIAKIEVSQIFEDDHRFLRRIAYVETEDGTNMGSFRGGIWALGKSKFGEVLTMIELAELRNKTEMEYSFDWSKLTWDNDLRYPFYSGLAARLYLSFLDKTVYGGIPLAGNTGEQAIFWYNYYHITTDAPFIEERYENEVKNLDKTEDCKVNTDLIFVLDESGSVHYSNFQEVKRFTYEFVSNIDVGPNDNQVGVIAFSSIARVVFFLNTYENKSATLQAVEDIIYNGGGTNTADGICKLIRYGFNETNGARSTAGAIFRVAVIITDGKSNEQSPECPWNTTLQAAEELHNQDPPILVFAIGVTQSINEEEVQAIATSPNYVTHIDSFSTEFLQGVQERQTYDLCTKVTIPTEIGNSLDGNLEENESIRYQFPIPVEGMSVRICVTEGYIIAYGSLSVPNSNSALYDWKIDVKYDDRKSKSENCDFFFVDPDELPNKPSSVSPTPSQTPTPQTPFRQSGDDKLEPITKFTDFNLFLSLTGKSQQNAFALESDEGDAYSSESSTDDIPIFVFFVGAVAIVVVIIIILLVAVILLRRTKRNTPEYYGNTKPGEDNFYLEKKVAS